MGNGKKEDKKERESNMNNNEFTWLSQEDRLEVNDESINFIKNGKKILVIDKQR